MSLASQSSHQDGVITPPHSLALWLMLPPRTMSRLLINGQWPTRSSSWLKKADTVNKQTSTSVQTASPSTPALLLEPISTQAPWQASSVPAPSWAKPTKSPWPSVFILLSAPAAVLALSEQFLEAASETFKAFMDQALTQCLPSEWLAPRATLLKFLPTVLGTRRTSGVSCAAQDTVKEIAQIGVDMNFGDRSSSIMFMRPLPPIGEPGFAVALWYAGTPAEATAHFARYLEAGPVANIGPPDGVTPAVKLNAPSDGHSQKGGRKPCAGVTCAAIDPEVMVQIWELYNNFIANNPDAAKESMVMLENMPAQIQPDRTKGGDENEVYPLRAYNCHVMAFVHYNDPAMDKAAEEYGIQIRKIAAGASGNSKAYVSFSSGDDTTEHVYGKEALEKLRRIKKVWGPEDVS